MIQDLRTDKVLWKYAFDQSENPDNPDINRPENNIRKLWAKNRKLFSAKLREHGIVATSFAMLGKTFTIGGNAYTTKIDTPRRKDADGQDRIVKVLLSLDTPKLGSKVLHQEDFTREEYSFTLDAAVIGAFKSPFENRVAILMIEVQRGYEGPPHPGDVRIVGADLTSGFDTR